ncbi:MAG: hypothetical protein ABF491_13125, partial [Acetobacter sp.]
AQDDEAEAPPTPRDTVPNRKLQRQLAILHFRPDAASDGCVTALSALHKTQDQLTQEEARFHDQDVVVAQDVLESDFENSLEHCSPDAQALCAQPNPSAGLAQACAQIDNVPEPAAD